MYDEIVIRQATEKDINRIAEIKINGWQAAFKNIVSDEYLNSMKIDQQVDKYMSSYNMDSMFVAEHNKKIVAFCRVYDYNEPTYDDEKIDCEVREIYVEPSLKRMGIGSKLFIYVLEYFKKQNKKRLYLGCFKDNNNSRNFYEKMGGRPKKCDNLVLDKSYEMVAYIFDL